ncbi:hypothetical protein HDU88_004565 [Geranomyces variabilis]|nr:hypothetical protein HDU88_004565 [Geranomyces variabilis]
MSAPPSSSASNTAGLGLPPPTPPPVPPPPSRVGDGTEVGRGGPEAAPEEALFRAIVEQFQPGVREITLNNLRDAVSNEPVILRYLEDTKKAKKTFGKLVEARLKSHTWWAQNFERTIVGSTVTLQRRGDLSEPLVVPAAPTTAAEIERAVEPAADEPWRWLGFSADDKRERIEAEIDEDELTALADVPLETGTEITVPSSHEFASFSRAKRFKLINRLRNNDTLGSVDLYHAHKNEVVHAASRKVVAPPVPATDQLPFRVPVVKSRADFTKVREMLGPQLWADLAFALEYTERDLDDVDEITAMEHHAPAVYHFAAPGWDMAFAPKLQAAHIKDMAKGLVFDDLSRAALPGGLHRLSTFFERGTKVPNQLTIRIGRTITGPAWVVADVIAQKKSVLITAPPAHGKTTFLRDIARLVPSQHPGKKVCVIDRSEELGGASIQWSSALGERVHVVRLAELTPGEAIGQAFRNNSPAVVMSDEIGTMAEAEGMISAKASGVEIISTAHGTIADVVDNAIMKKLAGNVVSMTVGDEWAQTTALGKKTRREREREPVFDVLIQILGLTEWRIFWSFAQAVDGFLEGKAVPAEIRTIDDNGVLIFRREMVSFEAEVKAEMPAPVGGD